MTQSVNQSRASVAVHAPRFRTGSVKTTLRIFATIYLLQAAIGIATGVAYAFWLMNW
jgi:hypothetical protein